MIKVTIKKEKSYPVSSPKLKKKLQKHLKKLGIVSHSQVSIALVGEKTMKGLGKKFLKEKESDPVHNVLSFPESEVIGKFVEPKGSLMQLGEIVVCYPVATEMARKEDALVEDIVWVLVEHAALHLIGVHHDH